jgi:hypothetical protein
MQPAARSRIADIWRMITFYTADTTDILGQKSTTEAEAIFVS